MSPSAAGLSALDVGILVGFVALCIGVGLRAQRAAPNGAGGGAWVAGGRNLPGWAVLLSLAATELSAATFLGVPHAAFLGDWFFLELGFGALVAKLCIARWILPRVHASGVLTLYAFLEERYGARTRRAAALCFLGGRTLASGARLFIAATALGVVTGVPIEGAIVAAGAATLLYTRVGGIRAVVWTDVVQAVVLLAGALVLLGVALLHIEGGFGALWSWASREGRNEVFHLDPLFALASPKPFGTAFLGGFFLTLATHSTDYDMIQRLLATRARSGARALAASALLNIPLTLLFLLVGTALARIYVDADPASSGDVVARFAATALPAGARGLVFAGLAAAALSSLDSALCAMASTWTIDVRGVPSDAPGARVALERATWVCGAALVAAALAIRLYAQHAPTEFSLVELALSAMTVLYGGLLGVFGWAYLGRASHDHVGVAALALGGVAGALLFAQPLFLETPRLAWTWWIPVSGALALGCVALGSRRPQARVSS